MIAARCAAACIHNDEGKKDGSGGLPLWSRLLLCDGCCAGERLDDGQGANLRRMGTASCEEASGEAGN